MVTLILLDNDTVTCDVVWGADNVETRNLYLTVRDGPVFDYDNAAFTGDPNYPLWLTAQKELYNETSGERMVYNVSLSGLLNINMSAYPTRVVGCTAVGTDQSTLLPVTISALSKFVLNVTALPRVWQDFTYPIYTKPCSAEGCISTVEGQGPGTSRSRALAEVQASSFSFMANYASNELLVAGNGSIYILQSPAVSTNETLDELRPFNGTQSSLRAVTGLSAGLGGRVATGVSPSSASKAVISFVPAGVAAAELLLDVGAADAAPCTMGTGQSSALKAQYLSGSWRHPATRDLYAVDSGCGLLYRYDNMTFQDPGAVPACSPFGSCGTRFTVANLSANSTFQAGIGQRTAMAGDAASGLLYIAYGGQCGVMAYNLTTGSKIGFVTSIDLPVIVNATVNITITTPVCGYAGT